MKRKRVARVPMIPMMPATRNRIALAMHAAVETLARAPSKDAATGVATDLAILTACVDFVAGAGDLRKSASWLAIESALATMERIQNRHDELGQWSVATRDAMALRAASAQFDHVLRLIPYNVYQAAEIYVAETLTAPVPPDDRVHRLLGAVTQ